MNRSVPGLPVHRQLQEFTQIHVHWVNDAIQSSHPLLPPFPPTLNLPQHQPSTGSFPVSWLFASDGQSIEASASVLPVNIQGGLSLGLTTPLSHRKYMCGSDLLAWRIPGTGEPGALPSLGLHRVRHNWSDLAAAAAVILTSPFYR